MLHSFAVPLGRLHVAFTCEIAAGEGDHACGAAADAWGRAWPQRDRVHPDDRDALAESTRRWSQCAPGDVVETGFRLMGEDGDWSWLLARDVVVERPGGERWAIGLLEPLGPRQAPWRNLLDYSLAGAVAPLARNVSRELANLLTRIDGSAELALRALETGGTPAVPLRELVGVARAATALLHNVMSFIADGASTGSCSVLPVNALVSHVLRMLEWTLGESVVIDLELDPRAGNIRVERAEFALLILGVAMRLKDATPNLTSVRITTSADGSEPPSPVVRLWVADPSGERPIAEDTSGTASAAALSALARFVHATLRDQGRRAVEIAFAAADGLPEEQAVRHGVASHRRLSILIVEDDRRLAAVLHGILAAEGHDVLLASSGRSAQSLAESYAGAIDLLVSSIDMPETNGVEVATQMRVSRPDLRVLLMSGHPRRNDRLAETLGAAAFLRKPFLPHTLLAEIARLTATGSAP